MADVGKILLFNPAKSIRVNRFSQRQCESRCTRKHEVVRVDGQGDEFPFLMGQALAQALSMNEDGAGFTHLAVMQDGIVPNDWFLDVLMEDLLEGGLDMVSAVVPYINETGCTTTAIDDPGDPYCPVRRLTLHEIFRLPEVFTAKDCGYPDHLILLGNECFVVDITKPWFTEQGEGDWLKLEFDDRCRLRRLKDSRIWAMKDDWRLSRHLQKVGAKVAATRRIVLTVDAERFSYPNQAPWGEWDYDKDTAHKFNSTPIAHIPQPPAFLGFANSKELPDVEGMLTDKEGALLAKLSEGKRCLDLAPYCGRATIWMSKTAREVVLLKPGDDQRDMMGRYVSDVLQSNLRQYGVGSKAVWVHEPNIDAQRLGDFRDKFDLIYVDSHDVIKGIDPLALVKPLTNDGLLVFRNAKHGRIPLGFDQDDSEIVANEGDVIVIRPTAEHHNKAWGLSVNNSADCSKVDNGELKAIGIG